MSNVEPQSFHRLAELFEAAWRTPAAERAAFLEAACAGDAELRTRVDSLLVHYENSSDPLRSNWVANAAVETGLLAHFAPPSRATSGAPVGPTAALPATIDRYELLERLGEGGFGEVYRARQTAPVVREVALKLIKPGMNSRQVITRFEAERQALALMDHPGIARVFDAGTTPHGRPYFVMELVRGVPITEFAACRKLSIRARVELFVPVCRAVEHAHQKGVIHRDLKPGNILVVGEEREAPTDGGTTATHATRPSALRPGGPSSPPAQPKIIDFGIAKATRQPLTEHTLETLAGHFIGTPAYMSPEQADLQVLDIDTRTDVYALGALLYELLAGLPPLDPVRLTGGGLAAMLRMIREVEPPPPSANTATVPVELDWIVLKCLQKDRTQRYPSAAALADDIERFLRHEPVLAGPQTTLYRLRKLVRRHRGFVLAATSIAVLLVAAVVGTTHGLLDARRQRDVAESRRTDAEGARRTAETVTRFLTDDLLMAQSDQRPPSERDERLSDVFVRAERRIDSGALSDQPASEAAIRGVLGTLASQLGRSDDAERHHRRRLELIWATTPNDHPEAVRALTSLAFVVGDQGRLRESIELFREALALARRERVAEPDTLATLYNNYAQILTAADELDAAEALYRDALRTLTGDAPQTRAWRAMVLGNLGAVLRQRGDLDGAIATGEQALTALRDIYGPESPAIASTLHKVGMAYNARGDVDQAERCYRQVIDMRRRMLTPDHPDLVSTLSNLATILRRQNNAADAEALHREALRIAEKAFRPGDYEIAIVHRNLGVCLASLKRFTEAELEIETAWQALSTTPGLPPRHERQTIDAFVSLYEAWARADPASGADVKAATWRNRRHADPPGRAPD